MRNLRASLLIASALLLGAGCKNKDQLEPLTPPDRAEGFMPALALEYDDQYTPTPIEMQGRAPNDVRDQRLFHARLGKADLVALVTVQQVWGRGLYQGKEHGAWKQYLDVEIGEVIMGGLGKQVAPSQLLAVEGEDLPASLEGQQLLMFLKWAPGEEPPFHHHLMPSDEAAVSLAKAMVEHAQAEGVLGDRGDRTRARRARKRRENRDEGADAP